MDNTKKKYPYELARFVASASRSYIEFRIWNLDKEALDRKRDYSINKYVATPNFEFFKDKYIREINELLVAGAYITSAQPAAKKSLSVLQALDYVISHKRQMKTRQRTLQAYATFKKQFLQYLDHAQPGAKKNDVRLITARVATDFNDYAITSFGLVSGYSIKNMCIVARSAFNTLVEAGYIDENPYTPIRNIQLSETKHLTYDKRQMKLITGLASRKCPEIHHVIQLIYYTFARINEIRLLRVHNVNLEQRVITIPPEISKNKITRTIEIPDPLYIMLVSDMKVDQAPGHYYLFSWPDGLPGTKPRPKNHFINLFRLISDELALPRAYTLYGIKHTGVIAHYMAGFDLRWLQDQTGHQDINQLIKYMRQLGLKIYRRTDLKAPKL